MASTTLKLDVKDLKGKGAGSIDLDEAYFGIQPNIPVMHQVVNAQLAARRAGSQSTKTRAEVSGGGAKPWRQKGTGRARAGSSRQPNFVGGGVTHAPKPRSYAQKTPKKMISLALRSALSDRAASGKVAVLDAWSIDRPSTKGALAALASLGVEGRVLMVLGDNDEAAWKSVRNLQHVHPILARELNAYDVLVADWVIFTRDTLPSSEPKPAEADVAISSKADAPAKADAVEKKPAAAEEPDAAEKPATKKAAAKKATTKKATTKKAATKKAAATKPAADASDTDAEEEA